MPTRTIRADSTEYLKVTLTSPDDISGDLIEMSFDDGATWHVAEHVTGGARLLVGPLASVQIPAGMSTVLVRVTDSPEVPVLPAGSIVVTS